MNHCKSATVLTVLFLAGCASHEGEYSPACVAYAGSIVSLDGSQFVWERFTDQVRVDDDGKVIDPFPGYPRRGSYTLDGRAVYMTSESGESLETMYLHKRDDAYLLLTAEENTSWQQTGSFDECVLTLDSATAK